MGRCYGIGGGRGGQCSCQKLAKSVIVRVGGIDWGEGPSYKLRQPVPTVLVATQNSCRLRHDTGRVDDGG